MYVAGTEGTDLIREVSSFHVVLIRKYHCIPLWKSCHHFLCYMHACPRVPLCVGEVWLCVVFGVLVRLSMVWCANSVCLGIGCWYVGVYCVCVLALCWVCVVWVCVLALCGMCCVCVC